MRCTTFVAALSALAVSASAFAAPTWNAFQIRSGGNATPIAATGTNDGSLFTALIDENGDKAGYGTGFFDGGKVSALTGFNYTRADTGAAKAYLNLWVSDGTHYAVIAPNTQVNPDGNTTGSVDTRGANLQTLGFNVYATDYSDLSWMYPNAARVQQALVANGHVVTLADIGNLIVKDPGTYSSFVGGGDPKNGTGFNIIVGDTQGNFTSGVPYVLTNVTVPEPTSLAALAGVAVLGLRRRRQA